MGSQIFQNVHRYILNNNIKEQYRDQQAKNGFQLTWAFELLCKVGNNLRNIGTNLCKDHFSATLEMQLYIKVQG
jgi:hypothetical protein